MKRACSILFATNLILLLLVPIIPVPASQASPDALGIALPIRNTANQTTTNTMTTVKGFQPLATENAVCTWIYPSDIGAHFILDGVNQYHAGHYHITFGVPYTLQADPPTGYYFDHWTEYRSVNIANLFAATTTVIFSDNPGIICDTGDLLQTIGYITAYYSTSPPPPQSNQSAVGFDTEGSYYDEGGWGYYNTIRLYRYSASITTDTTLLWADFNNVGPNYFAYCTGILYSDNSGYPGDKRLETSVVNLVVNGWYTWTISYAVTQGSYYWLGTNCYVSATNIARNFYDNGYANQEYVLHGSYGESSPVSPSPFPPGASGLAAAGSIFASAAYSPQRTITLNLKDQNGNPLSNIAQICARDVTANSNVLCTTSSATLPTNLGDVVRAWTYPITSQSNYALLRFSQTSNPMTDHSNPIGNYGGSDGGGVIISDTGWNNEITGVYQSSTVTLNNLDFASWSGTINCGHGKTKPMPDAWGQSVSSGEECSYSQMLDDAGPPSDAYSMRIEAPIIASPCVNTNSAGISWFQGFNVQYFGNFGGYFKIPEHKGPLKNNNDCNMMAVFGSGSDIPVVEMWLDEGSSMLRLEWRDTSLPNGYGTHNIFCTQYPGYCAQNVWQHITLQFRIVGTTAYLTWIFGDGMMYESYYTVHGTVPEGFGATRITFGDERGGTYGGYGLWDDFTFAGV